MKKALKFFGISIITAACLSTAACNTVQGAGQDVESVGKAGEDAIN